NGISFTIAEKGVFGLVGESGCGKSTTGKLILRLLEPTAGVVKMDGEDIFSASAPRMRELRKKMQIIFQDPYASLNPRMTIGSIVSEPFYVHNIGLKRDRLDMAAQLLAKVGMGADSLNRYPHEFSGGQRQRVGIARAIALNPRLVICDEPVSSLDVSIQAQVINLLVDLQEEAGMAYLFISHDLSVIEHMCDNVGVMYLGKIVEMARAGEIYTNPLHPYTEALLSATPLPDPQKKVRRIVLKGDVPSAINPPSGCVFHTRCPLKIDDCSKIVPPLTKRRNDHFSACIVR
ncbi:MAG TPA: ATP-binding cassette domain-containing protein, partial [Nitrospirae bacterium]|nr:ATP-binding cassette domain-containing protein [Nitrospirota bacterium]